MVHKIIIPEGETLESLQRKLDQGAKFIVFKYCISILFAVTLRRFSAAILIESDEETQKYSKKYNLISNIFGWWGIPWGGDIYKSIQKSKSTRWRRCYR